MSFGKNLVATQKANILNLLEQCLVSLEESASFIPISIKFVVSLDDALGEDIPGGQLML